jgi:hypothetical protein
VQARETLLDLLTNRFLNDRVFTERRAPLLAAQLPATDAEAEARRDADAAALQAQISKLDRQQNAQITALEEIDPDSLAPASNDMWALPQPLITGSLPQPSGPRSPTVSVIVLGLGFDGSAAVTDTASRRSGPGR